MFHPFKIDKVEVIGLITVFVFSFIFFYKDTFLFWGCLAAALITTALVAATWLLLKWLYLALR
jgi:ABC-type multidrug transport system permease subunit